MDNGIINNEVVCIILKIKNDLHSKISNRKLYQIIDLIKKRLTHHQNSQITIHNSQFSNYNSQITNLKLQFSILKSQISIHKSQITIHKSQITILNSQITTHELTKKFVVSPGIEPGS